MPETFVRNYLIFTAILLACVTVLGYILISGDRQIENSDDWVFHTHEVIIQSEQLNTFIARMVSAQRAYMMSNEVKFMEEYEEAKSGASKNLAHLSALTAKDLSQQSRLEEMRRYFMEYSEKLESRAARSLRVSPQQVLQDVETVNRLKANIFRLNSDFLEEEYNLLNQRVKIVENRKNQYFLTLLIGGGVAVILLMIFNGYLLRAQAKRSLAESVLSEKEEIFRLAIEGTHDGVFDWNIETGEVFYSDQFALMLGYEPSELNGVLEDFLHKLHPEETENVREYIDLYLGGQLSEYSQTFRMKHKSGRWVWIQSRAKLIHSKDGKPARLVGAHTDVSAAKEYEMKLQEAKAKAESANRAKSDFLAHMSHEIRTPLTTISGAAEILEQNKADLDEKKQSLISVLCTSSIGLKDLISDVLDFSKIENGEMELEEAAFDIQDAFEHIISIMSVRASEKNLDFTFDFKGIKNTGFYGDRIRLRQILINLIGNAIKFTEKGHVHVKATQGKKAGTPILRIDVKDTGIGIKEDHIDLIFERFKQADSSVSRKFGGTGLGLPISKKLADLMGGDIQVKSKFGKGSTFSLILPMRTIEGSEKEQEQNEVRKSKINDKLKSVISNTDKVLLVEDYEGNLVVIGYILEDMGIKFDTARTGLEAINLWKENHYDLILMDIQMPEMDGFTATSQIRRIENEQNLDPTPVIGMTAHALVGDKDKCIESGMDAYLPKPIVEMDLKTTILKFLKLRQKAA